MALHNKKLRAPEVRCRQQEDQMLDAKVIDALEAAVRKAISEMGMERFKQTSFFVSASSNAKNALAEAA